MIKKLNNIILDQDLEYINKEFKNKKIFLKKNILITGYEGFIGYELSNYFIKYFDMLKINTLYLLDVKKKRYKDKTKNKNIFFMQKDITKIDLEKTFKKNIDIIIHAASIASPTFYRKYPIKTIESNIFGLNKILKYSKKKKVKKILYFSSSEIYGDPDERNIPTNETYNGNVSSIGPRACYDEAKRMGETLCYVYNKEHNIPIVIVRPFNNYGPGLNINDKRLPADLAKNILDDKNIKIFSDGSPTRSFCYIADAVIGYLNAICYSNFGVFNIGNDHEETSVKKLAETYLEIAKKNFNYKGKIIYKKNKEKDYLTNNPNRRLPNLLLARTKIKYNPKIGLKEGVERYLNFLK